MRGHFLIATCALAITLGSSAGRASTLFAENFDGVATGTYSAGQAVGNFSVGTGTIDVVGPGFFPELCSGAASVNCVDLDGTSSGSLTTTSFNLIPGNYTLSFVLNGSQRGVTTTTTVSLGTAFNNTYTLQSNDTNNFSIPFTIVSAQTGALSFVSNTGGTMGSILDNVTLSGPTSGVPEPTSLALVGIGLAAAGLFSRRVRKA